jgi:thioredoxin 1
MSDWASEERDPTRDELGHLQGLAVVEFGATWCGFCQAIRPRMAALLEAHPEVRHIAIEDGPGRPLGRAFRVKLWPTLVFLRDGAVVRQLVRPSAPEIEEAFAELTGVDGPVS